VIESLPAGGLVGDWWSPASPVHVAAETTINQEHGPAAVGAKVEVKGPRRRMVRSPLLHQVEEPRVTARAVRARGRDREPAGGGLVGDWVSPASPSTSAPRPRSTRSTEPPCGRKVEVKGTQEADGSITACCIKVEETRVTATRTRHAAAFPSQFCRSSPARQRLRKRRASPSPACSCCLTGPS